MKKLFSLMFVMLAIMMPMKLWAQEPYAVLTTDSATILSQDSTGVTYGKTLTFYYDDQKATRGGMSVGLFTNETARGWSSYVQDITTVVFDDTFTNCTTLTSTAFWFYGCEKLTDISGIGNLKTDNVTNMSWMFGNCSCLTSLDISGFNTANVTDMGSMFFGCSDLTSLDLSSFNTGNVTSMQSMFLGCTGLTSLDVSNFKTYNVTNMSWMFLDCTGLTSLDLSSFNTSNVKYDANIYNYGIQSMFEGCSALTTIWVGDNWTTANLTESVDVFKDCAALVGGAGTHFDPNHVDYTYAHIDGGTSNPGYFTDKNASLTIEPYAVLTTDTTSVLSSDSTGVTYGQTLTFYYDNKKTERNGMSVGPFTETYDSGQERWNIDSGWDEKRENITTVVFDDSFANCTTLTSTAYWFYKCNKLTAISGIEYLKTDNVTNMRRMFDGCSGLTNLDVSNFKTDNVTNMSDMFFGCSGLTNLDVSNFKTDNVTDMSWLFSGCTGLTNLDVSNFKTDNVTNMSWLFSGCTGLTNLDVSNFKTDNVTDMNSMFYGCSGLTSLDVSNFKTNNVTNMSDMFYDCSGLTNLDVSGFKTDNVTDMNSMFYGCSGLTSLDVSNFKTDNVTNMSAMFFGCSGLTNLDVSNFNTANVTDMGYMFSLCFGLTTLDVSHFNTANVTDMGSMFGNCSSLTTLDVSNFKTDSVTDMSYMFLDCSGLTNLDVSNFKTDNVTNMSWMFDGCSGLTALDVSSFNTDNVTNMIGMFYGCSGLTSLDVSVFNTANVTDMGSMFRGCSSLTTLDVSNFNTDNVTNMGYMFNGCSSLTTIYIGNGWSTEAVTNGGNMFTGCTNLVGGASTAYDSNHVDHTYAHIDGGTSNPGYFTAKNQETDNKFSTCAEVGAGEDGKTYRVKGRVKSISNTTFGNWYIEDATDSLYIYGTVDYVGRYPRDGMSWESYGINVGDTVTVQGPKSTYKGVPELVDVRVLSPITLLNVSSNDTAMIAMINRESIRLAPNAATVTAKLYYAGSNCEVTIPDHAQSWLTLQSIEANNGDAEAIFSISDNITTGKRGAEVLFKTSNDSIVYETALFISQNDLELSPYAVLTTDSTSVLSNDSTGVTYGKTLTFYYDDQKEVRNGMSVGPFFGYPDDYPAWHSSAGSITKAVFDVSFANCSSITSTAYWFYECSKLSQIEGIENLKTDSVTTMGSMFESCSGLTTLDVSYFNTANVTEMWAMFKGCSSLTSLDVSHFNTQNVTSMSGMFNSCSSLTSLDVSGFKTDNVTTMISMFWGCSSLTTLDVSHFNTENVTYISGMFSGCSSLTSLDVSNFKTDNVTDMSGMFSSCSGLTSLDVSNFKTDNVTSMQSMFSGCTGLTSLDVSNFNTANVTNMERMFSGCTGLTSLDLSNFNTSKVTSMFTMFYDCSGLTSLDLSSFNTANVTSMQSMFLGCSGLTSLDLSNFNTENVTNMSWMFSNCSSLTSLDLSSFNTSNVKYEFDTNNYINYSFGIRSMFEGCSALTTIWVGDNWTTANLTESVDVFNYCAALVGGAGTHFDPDHVDYTYAHIDGGVDNPGYFTRSGDAPYVAPEAEFDSNGVLAVGGSTTMTDALESVGGRDEVAKTITAIVWNSSVALTNSDLQGLDNPNLLIYVNERSLAPQNRNNVVVNGLAMNVVLSDTGSGNCDFYAPQTFTAEMITYSREFKQATQVGVCRGWETIALPFMVQTIAHADNGVITPFGVDTSNKHFWLRQLSTNGLVSATKIEANVPYLISMPNDEKNYAKEYILKGLITFSAENAVVPKTEPMALALADSSVVMMPALQSVGKSSTVWALNVGQERSQYFEGSTFERDYREVRPFEAYTIHRSDTPAPRFLPINDLMNSATGIETISNVIMSHDNYYRLDGRKVDGKPTKKGLYITNGRKVVIK